MAPQPEIVEAEEAAEVEADPSERPSQRLRRDADLLGDSRSLCRRYLAKKIDAIVRGFEDQAWRSDRLDDWWNIYNCELDDGQFYNGNAQIYVPIIHDAINARATRFSNQAFPQSGRYVDVTATDGQIPYEIVALVNHYIHAARLKTAVVKPLFRNGDIEGQYNLYLDWRVIERQLVSRETRGEVVEGTEIEGEEIVDITEEDVEEGCPGFEVLHDSDVLVLPVNADSIEDALARGGSVTIVRRLSRETLDEMREAGEIRDGRGGDDAVMISSPTLAGMADMPKKLAQAIGIRSKGPHMIALETWTMMPLGGKGSFSERGTNRLCRVWWGLDREPLGARRNPYWNDRCPLLSAAVEKIAGVFKGKSQVEALAPLQYEANDAANERADVDHMAAGPILTVDPSEGNQPFIYSPGAVWKISPDKAKFLIFPDLSARATSRVQAAQALIFQSLGVNPGMLPQQSGRPGQKRNQAEVAMEQAVDLLTTAEQVSVADEGILTPLVSWLVDLDHQFRDRDLTVRAFGELGLKAEMIDVPPMRNRAQYSFTWAGAEQARMNLAMQQQGTAFINVLRGMRQDLQAEGMELRLGALLQRQALNIFGPIAAAGLLLDMRHQISVDPEMENDLLADGHPVSPHVLDDDKKHLESHMMAAQMSGDPNGTFRVHIQEHLMQMAMKNRAALMQMAGGQGAPGVPGGAGPGVAGTPQPGAVPAGPRQIKSNPGTIPQDQLPRAGAVVPPRRA